MWLWGFSVVQSQLSYLRWWREGGQSSVTTEGIGREWLCSCEPRHTGAWAPDCTTNTTTEERREVSGSGKGSRDSRGGRLAEAARVTWQACTSQGPECRHVHTMGKSLWTQSERLKTEKKRWVGGRRVFSMGDISVSGESGKKDFFSAGAWGIRMQ